MSKKKRRRFSASEKVQAVRRHLIEKVSVSEICEGLNIHPTQYYKWQTLFFENGEGAFSREHAKENKALEKQISKLESTVEQKNNVIAIIAADNIDLKKKFGDL